VVFVKGSSPKGLVVVLHALGLQSWDPGYVLDLNFTTWSISVEFVFYALFPFLLPWFLRQKAHNVLFLGILVWVVQSVQHYLFVNYLSDGSKKVEEFISAFPLWHLGTFFSGMVCARVISLDNLSEIVRSFSLTVFFVSLACFALVIYVPNHVLKYVHNGLLSPLFAMMVMGLYYDRSLVSRTLSRPIFGMLGDLSYGLFIFQYPLWVICTRLADQEFQSKSLFFFIYLFIVMTLSYLMNRWVEKPLREYLRRPRENVNAAI
jgi:peptidoglycan/LPS O-acetylase OafA/YrhL